MTLDRFTSRGNLLLALHAHYPQSLTETYVLRPAYSSGGMAGAKEASASVAYLIEQGLVEVVNCDATDVAPIVRVTPLGIDVVDGFASDPGVDLPGPRVPNDVVGMRRRCLLALAHEYYPHEVAETSLFGRAGADYAEEVVGSAAGALKALKVDLAYLTAKRLLVLGEHELHGQIFRTVRITSYGCNVCDGRQSVAGLPAPVRLPE